MKENLKAYRERLEEQARGLPDGSEKQKIEDQIEQVDRANQMEDWLATKSRPPK